MDSLFTLMEKQWRRDRRHIHAGRRTLDGWRLFRNIAGAGMPRRFCVLRENLCGGSMEWWSRCCMRRRWGVLYMNGWDSELWTNSWVSCACRREAQRGREVLSTKESREETRSSRPFAFVRRRNYQPPTGPTRSFIGRTSRRSQVLAMQPRFQLSSMVAIIE